MNINFSAVTIFACFCVGLVGMLGSFPGTVAFDSVRLPLRPILDPRLSTVKVTYALFNALQLGHYWSSTIRYVVYSELAPPTDERRG